MKVCAYCREPLQGRSDKKYCSPYCKSAYHYQISKADEGSTFRKIDAQLKKNRRILKAYNKSGKATVRKQTLLDEGFEPRYFTHYWKNRQGAVYLFCYEYGFLEKKENGRAKYVLVVWQGYMLQQ